jgi:SAM-dependent methyltransferase
VHDSAYKLVQTFANSFEHLPDSVADIGAYDMNGCLKPLFGGCGYIGMDIRRGPNVDRVIQPYDFGEDEFDVVVSANVMEHIQDVKRWAQEIVRICKPGGLICIVAPHHWHEHCNPDCWRILPDGMRWAFDGVEILDCRRANSHDTILIARKPGKSGYDAPEG